MIAASVGLLVVAAVLLFVGIAKSSLAPLVLSLLATLGAGALLYASFHYYRQKAIAEGRIAPDGQAGAAPGYPAAYAGPGVPVAAAHVSYVPVVAPPNGSSGLPVDDWDDLLAADATKLVQTLNLDELHTVRRHEVEHQRRTTVLRAIDKRIDDVVELRRSVASS